jgi:hypothetical protein
MQLSRLYNKRVQNEADRNPESSSSGVESPAVADEAGAGFNIVQIDVLNESGGAQSARERLPADAAEGQAGA